MVLDNTKLGASADKKSAACAVYWAISVYNVPWLQSEHDAQITKACVSRKLFIVNEGMFETGFFHLFPSLFNNKGNV